MNKLLKNEIVIKKFTAQQLKDLKILILKIEIAGSNPYNNITKFLRNETKMFTKGKKWETCMHCTYKVSNTKCPMIDPCIELEEIVRNLKKP